MSIKEDNKDIKKSVKISIFGNEYIIGFPNVGQILEIEDMKQILSGGKYGEFIRSGTNSSLFALDMIDAIAVFSVLIPDLKKSLETDNYMKMEVFKGKELKDVYINQFYPWYSQVLRALYQEDNTNTGKKENGQENG